MLMYNSSNDHFTLMMDENEENQQWGPKEGSVG